MNRLLPSLLALVCAGIVHAQFVSAWTQVLPSSAVELRDPRSISLTSDGLLYVADTGHHRILAVDTLGRVLYETGGFGTAHGQFQWPRKIVANRGASVWVLDYGNRRIEKFSRTLQYQGTFTIPPSDDGALSQIEAFALAPQGDVYVFDRDDGQIVRYDPLFRELGKFGDRSGEEFVSTISQMTFAPSIGLTWWARGSDKVRATDPLFSAVRTLSLPGPEDQFVLAATDSCILMANSSIVQTWCDPTVPPTLLFRMQDLQKLEVRRLDDLAVAADGTVWLLDGLSGAVFRLFVTKR